VNVALTGHLTVARPPERAFELFTPRGEQTWVAGWQPRFPTPTTDDSAPGTVFETDVHGRLTTWVVIERTPGRRIRYARVVPGDSAGTVTVELTAGAAGRSDVTVTYELTALTEPAARHLHAFAAGYADMLRHWADAITAALTERDA
jgi:uncharacterized protein YndB with AHSA1/START domain